MWHMLEIGGYKIVCNSGHYYFHESMNLAGDIKPWSIYKLRLVTMAKTLNK